MELEERVAELERRMAALERGDGAVPPPAEGDFWALEGLKSRLAGAGAADGGVLFTGAVRLPTGERYEWQYGVLADEQLDGDWTEAAESFAALGHPVRLRLLREILGGRRTAAELAELEEIGTTGQIYHHVRQLTGAGWLHTAGRGRYEVPPGRVVPLLVALATARP
ncbi:ArsR family transcriptional regulator [Streptomyces sp. WAC05374]|uniref:ArsR/SmtB family transcription factor n=1 Tax=unclassified Streptomyces TaxID=2593676 RepID=UPI000F86C69C|nr:helix-turn-helix domain-containing protein [Streptomyces sp. WAC05374]RST13798.1 ArsR family transcriptional regulator [Streptomyces sp. WAC05374]TDF36135.1 ArsR family transcriptional regulator [Streptomyces sp. WAC05374]TDF45097.1 ArsR family transcriptional regulator [Streptomyces sp. WAC05374]TDF56502.1 ArsR family transcriptional regulator [Streptomyces sp. WAC05374]